MLQQQFNMPKRSRSGRTFKRKRRKSIRRYIKRRRNHRRGLSVVRGLGFADRCFVRMRYVTVVSIDPLDSASSGYAFRADNVYDPNLTSVGGDHTAYGYDEWRRFYKRYCVVGSKCTATFIPSLLNQAGTISAGVGAVNVGTVDAVTPVPLAQMYVRKGTRFKIIPTMRSGPNRNNRVRGFYSPKKMYGVKDIMDNQAFHRADGQTTGDATTYFNVTYGAMTAGQNPFGVNVVVAIDYLCMWYDRRTAIANPLTGEPPALPDD